MKLLEIASNKPRVRLGPDGRLIPVLTDVVDQKPKGKPSDMQAAQQTSPASPAAPPPAATPVPVPLSSQQKAKQAQLKASLQAKRAPPVGTPSLASVKQQASLARRMGSRDPSEVIKQIAKGNQAQIPNLLNLLTRAMNGSPQIQQLSAPRTRRQPRVMSRDQADAHLRKLGIQIESYNNTNIPLALIAQLAQQMPKHELIKLIKDIEDIRREGTPPGQQPTGNYRKDPSLLGTQRDDTPGPAPRRGLGGKFIDWLKR